MKKILGSLFAFMLLGVAGFAFYLWQEGPTYQPPLLPQSPSAQPADAPAPPAAASEPVIRYPVQENVEKPLPPLGKSDPTVQAALADVFGKNAVKRFFQPRDIIRRIVATVDNLPRRVVSAQLMPTTPVRGKFVIAADGDKTVMAAANFARYTPFVRLASMVDAKTFVAAYTALYPLFQQAYRELGYPKGYFNDRLVAVIDHMLEAPEIEGPVVLVQPQIFYRFADPELESLSAGHKLMLRIGNENAAVIKKKLREIRSELTGLEPKAGEERAAAVSPVRQPASTYR